MTPGKPVTLNRDVEPDDGLPVIPANTTGVLFRAPDFIVGRDRATVVVDFDPPIGRRTVPYRAVDGPPHVGDVVTRPLS